MNPLRFRSLPDRKSIAAFLLLTAVSAPSLANPGLVTEVRNQIQKDCEKEAPEAVRIYADRSHERLLEAFDPTLRCQSNKGDEVESHNARALPHEVWNRRPDWVDGDRNENANRRIGACRKNYLVMRYAHDKYVRLYRGFCVSLRQALDNAASCGEPSKKCEAQYKEVKEKFTSYSKDAKEFGATMKRYLGHTAKASEEAAKRFEADLRLLDAEFRRRAASPAAVRADETDVVEGHAQLKPANGGLRTKSLKEYYEALSGQDPTSGTRFYPLAQLPQGPLILEQKEAATRVTKFSSDLDTLVGKGALLADSNAERWQSSILANIDKAGNADKDKSTLNSKLAMIGPVTGAGTQFAGMLNQQNHTGGSIVNTAATSGPSLAAIGAAAAAGAALSSNFGAAGSSQAAAEPFSGQQAPAEAFTPPTVNKLDDGAEPQAGAVPGATHDLPKTGTNADGAKVEQQAAAAFPAFGAGEGTSRMISGTKKGGAKAAPTAAAAPDVGIGEDGFSNFGSRGMDPKPGPKGNSLSPGAEVANLLGQMKDLFNFDEGGSPAGSPGGGFGPGAEPPLDPSLGSGYPGSELPADGEPGETAGVADAGETQAAQAGEVQGAQFGKVDTSLFKRVRQRHTRCMERGLVLYQLGERVE